MTKVSLIKILNLISWETSLNPEPKQANKTSLITRLIKDQFQMLLMGLAVSKNPRINKWILRMRLWQSCQTPNDS
jgi:hypothetical protein